MGLSTLLLGIFLVLLGISLAGLVAIASWVLGLFALAAGIAILLEGFGVYKYEIRR